MLKRLIPILLLLTLLTPVLATGVLPPIFVNKTSGGGSSLPLDGISTGVKACYSTRQLLTVYAGNAMTVTRSSDSTTQTVGFSSHVLNTSALSTFCSGTTCKVTTWNDQCGGGFDQTSAAANAPIIYQSSAVNTINSQPAALFVSATPTSLANAGLSPNPVNTLYQNAVVSVNTGTTGTVTCGAAASNGVLEWRVDSSSGDLQILANSVASIATSSSGISSATGALIETQYNSSTGVYGFWINRSTAGSGTQTQSMTAGTSQVGACGVGATLEPLNGSVGEIIMYDLVGGIPGASQTSIENNQHTYWGTP